MRRRDVVLVTDKIHSRFVRVLRNFHFRYPVCYMLGRNMKGVIEDVVRLKSDGSGCGNMPTISVCEMSKGLTKLVERNLIGAGLIRIGCFSISDNYQRGHSLSDIRKMSGGNGIIISFTKKGVAVERLNAGKKIKYDYAVVKEEVWD